MEGHSWSEVDRRSSDDTDVAQLVVDYLSADRTYPIVEKYIARQDTLVRAAFHDYYCEDDTASQQAFEPIITSLAFSD